MIQLDDKCSIPHFHPGFQLFLSLHLVSASAVCMCAFSALSAARWTGNLDSIPSLGSIPSLEVVARHGSDRWSICCRRLYIPTRGSHGHVIGRTDVNSSLVDCGQQG